MSHNLSEEKLLEYKTAFEVFDKDKDGEGVAEIITASPASPSSPLPSNQESEDDDVETSSLLSDLDWYLDYVQGRSSHR